MLQTLAITLVISLAKLRAETILILATTNLKRVSMKPYVVEMEPLMTH